MNQIGVLLVSHGNFAKSALESAELIVGKQDNCSAFGIFETDNVSHLREEISSKLAGLKNNNGVIIFTDINGGSPNNISLTMLEDDNIIVCSGFNMPVLLETLLNRHLSLVELKSLIEEAYKGGLSLIEKKDLELEEEENDLL